MIGLLSAAVAALAVGGIILLIDGLTPKPVARRSKPTSTTPTFMKSLTARERVLALVGFAAGLVIALISGWVILVVALPVAMVGVPRIVSTGNLKRSTDRLQALEDWTRSLAGVLTSGLTLENALHATRRAAPDPIAKEVNMLCSRLRSAMATDVALRAFAKDLDDATADLVSLMLIEASRFQGVALADQLSGVAASVSEDVRARRQIMAAQREPQSTASLMTWIMIGAMGLFSTMGDFIAPYRTPVGQAILAVLLSLFGALLVMMKKIAMPATPPRIMGPTSRHITSTKESK